MVEWDIPFLLELLFDVEHVEFVLRPNCYFSLSQFPTRRTSQTSRLGPGGCLDVEEKPCFERSIKTTPDYQDVTGNNGIKRDSLQIQM